VPADPAVQPDPARALIQDETLAQVCDLMDGLPDKQREVLELKFRHGLSYKEISGVTSHPIGQVGWLIHRGIRTLRERMASELSREAAEGMA
jgi:RNA polymerase sigma-70 factor (ECF subfamily)